MLRYLRRRLLWGLVGLFLLLTFVFFFTQLVMPSDFTSSMRIAMTADQVAEVRHQLGLDLPLWLRYLRWLGDVVTGHLGDSFYGVQVLVRIEGPLVWSLLEFVVAMTLAFLVGSWWGRVAGWRPERKVGRVLSFAAVGAESAFPPWLTFIVAYGLVAVAGRGVFGSMGQLDRSVWVAPPDSLGVMVRMLTAIVFFFAVSIVLGRVGGLRRWRRRWTVLAFALAVAGPVVVWVQTGIWAKVVDVLGFLALPTVAMVVLFYGEIMLIVESVVQDVRSEPYVMTARAKGLPGRRVRDRHAGRMALLPAISRLAISLPFFMTGLVIVEFSLSHQTAGNLAIGASGIGTLLFFSIQAQDIPTVMGLLLVIGVLTLLVRLVLDVVAAALDPRIRMGGQEVPARRRV